MKTAWQFIKDASPIIVFYLAVGLVILFGVLKHPESWTAQPPAKTSYLPNGSSETVPHRVSCYIRNNFEYIDGNHNGYCQPERFDI